MCQSTTFQRVFIKILSCILLGATFVSCQPSLPTPPVKVPFGLGKGGESVEFDFRVKDTYGYVVGLDFLFKDIKEFQDKQAREALIDQLGARFAADGSIPFVRVPITLRIRVNSIDVEGPPVNFDHTTDQIGFTYASKEFASKQIHMRINAQKLQPGTYRIRVDNLYSVPQFADRSVNLTIHYANQGK